MASSYPSTVLDRRHANGANSPSPYRGEALLISMERGKDGDRQGAAVDRGTMLSLFQMLFFSVSTFLDYSADDLISKLKEKSEEIDRGTTDCFVCFVSAHGNTDADGSSFILDQSGNKVYILDHIIKPFMDSPLLRGKPKVFFINACRGNYHMTPDSGRSENTSDNRPSTSRSAEKTVQYLKNHTDCLVVFSTGEGNQSGRSPTDGTYFVQALSDAVSRYYNEEDVLSMMTIMNKGLIEFKSQHISKKNFRVCQGAVIDSKLSSKLYWKTHSSEASGTGVVRPAEPVSDHLLLVYDSNRDKDAPEYPELDVVFFHGYEFGGREWRHAALSSWFTQSSEPVFWPGNWLPKADGIGIPIRVFCVRYSPVEVPRTCPKDQKLSSLAERLQKELKMQELGKTRSLLFVGHGLGGLLIKAILNSEDTHMQCLKDWLIGIVFYGVPYVPQDTGSCAEEVYFSLPALQGALEKEPEGHLSVVDVSELEAILRGDSQTMKDAHENFKSFKKKVLSFEEGGGTNGFEISRPAERYATEVNTIVDNCSMSNHFDICRPTSRSDSIFKELLNFIRRQLNCGQPETPRPQNQYKIVGQDAHFQKLKKCLMSREAERAAMAGITGGEAFGEAFGVSGMGGIGKTTLAKTLYDDEDIRDRYDSRVYWVAIKRNPDIVSCQRSLMNELCKEMPTMDLDTEEVLRQALQKKLKIMKKILLFLDDVWEKDHVDRLLGDPFIKTLPPGSKCVMTSRKPAELAKIDERAEVEKLDFLNDKDSRKLFCYKAFSSEDLPQGTKEDFQTVAKEVIDACNNIPILLATVGAERWGKRLNTIESWKQVRDRLRNAKAGNNSTEESAAYDKMIEQVKISYDDLPELSDRHGAGFNLKEYFLDFAAFPEREEIEIAMVMDMWTRPGLTEDGAYRILEQLEQRCLVKIVGYWCYVHDIFRALAVRLIEGKSVQHRERLFAWGIKRRLPDTWTSARSECEDLPSSESEIIFDAEKMVIARSELKEFHPRDSILFKCLTRLRMLVLTSNFNLVSLPSEIGYMTALEKLDLSWCLALKSLPPEIGQMTGLEKLNMAGCCLLTRLPSEIGGLKKLLELNMQSCGVGELPPQLGDLTSLKYLCLNDCNELEVLPPEMGKLSNLEKLDCDMLEIDEIPEVLGNVTTLKHISFSSCGGITKIPSQFAQLKSLVSMCFTNSPNLSSVPDELDKLVTEGSLQSFNVYNTKVVHENLPQALRELSMPFDGNPRDSEAESTANPEGAYWSHKRGQLVDPTSCYDSGNKEERRLSFGLARMVALAKAEPFMSPRFKMAIRIMYTMANHDATRHTILKNGGIPVLLRCIDKGHPSSSGTSAAATLSNICVTFSTHKAIVDARGLEILTRVLHRRNHVSSSAFQALRRIMEADKKEEDYAFTTEIYERCGHTFGQPGCACIFCQHDKGTLL